MSHSNRQRGHMNRRVALFGGAAGARLLLRGLATGLPVSWLTASGLARAQEMNADLPQMLILSTSQRGDPVNINCPGSYVRGVENNPILSIEDVILGGRDPVQAAAPWAQLPAELRDQLAFIHYSSRTAAHPEFVKAMTLHGAVKTSQGNGVEMLSSALASLAADPLNTKQREPIPLSGETVTFEGQPLQNIKPSEIKALFEAQEDDLANLRSLRDTALDSLYRDLRSEGTRAQRKFLDRFVTSRDQARSLGEELGSLLNGLSTDPDVQDQTEDQIIAAVALTKLRIAPVINITIPFGGDNHNDADLSFEALQTTSGVQQIGFLWSQLHEQGLGNSVSFALQNVFGRTFTRNGQGGRNHNRYHAVMVAFGSRLRGGVYGGVNSSGAAMNIDSMTGAARESGGISAELALEAAGVSLALALGHPEDLVIDRIRGGEPIRGLLRA